jgi:MFS family permease
VRLNVAAAVWLNWACSVAFAALHVALGAIADRVGRRRMFMIVVVCMRHRRRSATRPVADA